MGQQNRAADPAAGYALLRDRQPARCRKIETAGDADHLRLLRSSPFPGHEAITISPRCCLARRLWSVRKKRH